MWALMFLDTRGRWREARKGILIVKRIEMNCKFEKSILSLIVTLFEIWELSDLFVKARPPFHTWKRMPLAWTIKKKSPKCVMCAFDLRLAKENMKIYRYLFNHIVAIQCSCKLGDTTRMLTIQQSMSCP